VQVRSKRWPRIRNKEQTDGRTHAHTRIRYYILYSIRWNRDVEYQAACCYLSGCRAAAVLRSDNFLILYIAPADDVTRLRDVKNAEWRHVSCVTISVVVSVASDATVNMHVNNNSCHRETARRTVITKCSLAKKYHKLFNVSVALGLYRFVRFILSFLLFLFFWSWLVLISNKLPSPAYFTIHNRMWCRYFDTQPTSAIYEPVYIIWCKKTSHS